MLLRLASYNLHKCRGMTGPHAPDRNLAVIGSLGADIVALQEVDFRLGPRHEALPRRLIREATGLVPVDLRGTSRHSLGWHGQTLLMRPDLARRTTLRRLPLPGIEPRGAIAALLPGLTVVALHLGLIRSSRRAQLARIAGQVARLGGTGEVVLTGDFNEWHEDRGLEALEGFRVIAPGPSWPALQPTLRYDRFALSPGLHIDDFGVEAGEAARRASDHLPVWLDMRLPDPAPSGLILPRAAAAGASRLSEPGAGR